MGGTFRGVRPPSSLGIASRWRWGHDFPQSYVAPDARFRGEPAIGSLRRRVVVALYLGALAAMLQRGWICEIQNRDGQIAIRVVGRRDLSRRGSAEQTWWRGAAVYRHDGRWSWAVVTKRAKIRGGGCSPYDGAENETMAMVMGL